MTKNSLCCFNDVIYFIERELKGISDAPKFESRLIISFVLGVPKEKLYALENDFILSEQSIDKILYFVNKRKKGVPLFYLFRKKEFMELEFEVNHSVLIPRPETEIIVEEALSFAKGGSVNVLDIGTGSGCILLSFLYYNSAAFGIGLDISKDALAVARRNAYSLDLSNRVSFVNSDFRDFSSDKKFDIVLSNPPYVKSARVYSIKSEPSVAVDGGVNGIGIYPDLVKKSFELLKIEGYFIVEIDEDMGETVSKMFIEKGFIKTKIINDLSGKNRFVSGLKK
jgi:release factor glutamine methyltransferase